MFEYIGLAAQRFNVFRPEAWLAMLRVEGAIPGTSGSNPRRFGRGKLSLPTIPAQQQKGAENAPTIL